MTDKINELFESSTKHLTRLKRIAKRAEPFNSQEELKNATLNTLCNTISDCHALLEQYRDVIGKQDTVIKDLKLRLDDYKNENAPT